MSNLFGNSTPDIIFYSGSTPVRYLRLPQYGNSMEYSDTYTGSDSTVYGDWSSYVSTNLTKSHTNITFRQQDEVGFSGGSPKILHSITGVSRKKGRIGWKINGTLTISLFDFDTDSEGLVRDIFNPSLSDTIRIKPHYDVSDTYLILIKNSMVFAAVKGNHKLISVVMDFTQQDLMTSLPLESFGDNFILKDGDNFALKDSDNFALKG